MKWLTLAACVLGACSGVGTNGQSVLGSTSTAHQSPGDESMSDSDVAEAKCSLSAPAVHEPQTHEQILMAPRQPGFWCARYRRTPDANRHIDACYLTRATCVKLRDEGIAEGAQITSCESAAAAFCFTMADRANQKVYWRCYQSNGQCSIERQKFTKGRPDLEFGDCAISRAPSLSRQPAASLRMTWTKRDRPSR